ncbi:hypothetical protein SLS64_007781 [Diaporthe eres]|uniref:Fungal STAND N-terminal Goodbye domain-containing protein n=1 Tax=Diaporthe eres TaxID=83184 RepID=A0ABR1P673_DIAER
MHVASDPTFPNQTDVLSLAVRKFHNAPEDSANALRAIRLLAEDVKRSVDVISKDIPEFAQSGDDRALQDISKECGQLAVGILAQIEKLRVDGQGLPRKMRALRVSAKFWFEKKEIDDMLARLIALEARLRYWWFPTYIYQHGLTVENNMIMAIRNGLGQLKSTANRLEIGQYIRSGLEAGLDQMRTYIKSTEDAREISARRAALEDTALNFRNYKQETNRVRRHHCILMNRIFDSVYTRENKIEVAHINTIEWLFESLISNFRVWLETGSGVYWISGLANGLDEYHGAKEDIIHVLRDLWACP